jgi:hypothetical protein
MKLKKVNRDPFSNGTEYMMFEERCCDRCVKHSHLRKEGDTKWDDEYTKIVCAIERDILTRMYSNEPIKQETIDVCNNFIFHGTLCPYMKTERKKYKKKDPINQQKLDL